MIISTFQSCFLVFERSTTLCHVLIAFHLKTDVYSNYTIQVLEEIFRDCFLEFGGL